jgi:Nif-specific regulatory protein
MEKERLEEALTRVGWVKAKAGRILGLTPRQVAYKMKKYNLSPGRQLI